MKTIKSEMIKLFLLSGIGLFILLYVFYKSVTYFIIQQEYQKVKLLVHTLVYTRDYLAKLAPYVELKSNYFHPFAITPAYVVGQITAMIKEDEHFEIRQTSDRYRDILNKASKYDLEAIEFLKKHPQKEDYFVLKNINDREYFFYAYPLRVEKNCLKCHGNIKEIPQELYKKLIKYYGNRAFGYKLGELRGIISIKFPFNVVKEKINRLFLKLALFLLVIYIIGIIVFLRINSLILKDIKKINSFMKENLSKNIFRPMKEKFFFIEFELIKNQINETVKSIKTFKRESYNNMYYNNLTGYPNRIKLKEVLKRKKTPIIVIDIDSFKEINYFYGENFADTLILQVAKRLEKLNPFHTKIDQFVILSKIRNKDEIYNFSKKVLEILEEPYIIYGIKIFVKFRIGISFCKKEFKEAVTALESTRFLNKDIVFASEVEHLKKQSKQHLEWIKKLKDAIKEDRIIPHFQPIVNKELKVCKYEVLMRIKDEKGKIISPSVFLEVAKKSRLYFDLIKIMLNKVFDIFETNNKEFSLNLTMLDMQNKEIRNFIIEKLKTFPEPSRVNFEIVESEDIKKSEETFEFIKQLKSFGCKILIDDFGSGYANFDYLFLLNANGIKIDGSLIRNILNDRNSQIIVKTIIAFAKEVNMQVIAEYVETKEIFEYLKSLGVDCFQGHFYSPSKENL
ncbi:MAG: EAL domain-containing protein [Nautiliaceae bacterium]